MWEHWLTSSSDYGLSVGGAIAVANLQANIVSTLQGGCFVGALAASWVSDTYGRKIALIVSALVTLVGVVLQFCSFGQLPALYVGR
jgi:MFS family permease